MTIHLSGELEKIIHDAVRAGLYARDADVIRDALIRLKMTLPPEGGTPIKKTKDVKPSKKTPTQQLLSRQQVLERMMASGLITRLPNPAEDIDDDDPEDAPVVIKGEPLSETIIRERR